MAHESSWPPVSPRAALLSSPSGRKKYEAMKHSPTKQQPSTTPRLLDRLREARTGNSNMLQEDDDDDLDDDEEILQLKLAAIEAKLRLKRIQQSKARASTPVNAPSRPGSSHGTSSKVSAPQSSQREARNDSAQVEVGLSPVKRLHLPSQPRSPSRVLLGIDKGVRATDVSLRRANTIAGSTSKTREAPYQDRSSSLSSAFRAARSGTPGKLAIAEKGKTFSARISEAREKDKDLRSRREAVDQNRSKGFGVDQTELETYRRAAEESRDEDATKPRARTNQHVEYTREEVLHAAQHGNFRSKGLHNSRTMPDPQGFTRPSSGEAQEEPAAGDLQGDASLYEGFSQLHLSSRILPHSFLKRTLPSERFTIYRVPDLLRDVKAPAYELPEDVCDYVVFAVIASKSGSMDHKKPPSDKATVGNKDWERKWEDGSQNHRRFMALTITDLQWTVDVYLFGTALPRYHRLTPGTVVAILNPSIMPPKPGREDTGAFSLSLSAGEDTVLEIGTARDLGHCKTIKKDGRECGSWINASKTEICEWHLNAELNKAQASRMGVNTGSNGFGRNGLYDKRSGNGKNKGLLGRQGQQYDRHTQSQFYIAKSNATGSSFRAQGSHFAESPYGSEGQLDRDKNERIRKHFAAQQKEREIAEKLGSLSGDHGFGGAGAEYLRQQSQNRARDVAQEVRNGKARGSGSRVTCTPASSERGRQAGGPRSGVATRAHLLSDSTSNTNGKRTAEHVRLSPVKKTRFVTERGIREAGRESLGVATQPGPGSDSDDELEIV